MPFTIQHNGENTNCRYCHEKGHTIVVCPTLLAKKARTSRLLLEKYDVRGLPPMPTLLQPLVMPTPKENKNKNKNKQEKEVIKMKLENRFDSLMCYSSEDEDDDESSRSSISEDDDESISKNMQAIRITGHKRPDMMSWADLCESDYETDEEY